MLFMKDPERLEKHHDYINLEGEEVAMFVGHKILSNIKSIT